MNRGVLSQLNKEHLQKTLQLISYLLVNGGMGPLKIWTKEGCSL
jgi:hypothetical protein